MIARQRSVACSQDRGVPEAQALQAAAHLAASATAASVQADAAQRLNAAQVIDLEGKNESAQEPQRTQEEQAMFEASLPPTPPYTCAAVRIGKEFYQGTDPHAENYHPNKAKLSWDLALPAADTNDAKLYNEQGDPIDQDE